MSSPAVVVKKEPSPEKPAPPSKTSNNNNNNNSAATNGSSNPNGKALPSFSELLWCTDVDGDVMSQGIGGAMVRITNKALKDR